MQFERDCPIFFSFFPSLPLRNFPYEQKFYAKAYEQRKVLRKTQASDHIWVDFLQT